MIDVLWEWLQARLGSPPLLAIIMILLASVLIVFFSYIVGATTSDPWNSGRFWLAFLSEFSKIIFAAIVTGAVLKVLVVTGFFERAVADIIFAEKGLEILSPDRHIEIWKSLTARIYAPSFRAGSITDVDFRTSTARLARYLEN